MPVAQIFEWPHPQIDEDWNSGEQRWREITPLAYQELRTTVPLRQEAQNAFMQAEPAHTPIPDDWREMSNADLNGSHIPGSADEKIRRSIEAVQEFNAGLDKEDQWSITPTVLQKLSGSNANRIKDYLSRHPEIAQMLKQYNSGFGYHQNRYRGDPREAMR